MNPSSLLVNAVLNGVLGSGRKRTRNATRYLTGRHGGLLSNPAVLMTAVGAAWGVFETLQQSGALGRLASMAGVSTMGGASGAAGSPPGPAPHPAVPQPPPPQQAGEAALPPLPGPDPSAATAVDPTALRLVRLAISAANADGVLTDQERAAVMQQGRAIGMTDFVEREIAAPQPLSALVTGTETPEEAATLYVLAFTILRADESVKPTERVYLAQLAHLLRLDQQTVQALEQDTGSRIDALGDQGQPGG